ncbi:MAG TPA: PfkB family carbohydrate kinase [Solirubrobacteraceae bacterium]|nr:PfkB family carbohydrate kinase [Solirubrobacteraceae bacterium]
MIVCVGLATRDAVYRVPSLPEPDGRVVASARLVAGGGPAATAAVAIARLGVPVRFVGVIDDDLDGVDVVPIPGRMATSTVLVADGTRAIIAEEPQPFACPPAALEDAEWVHVDHVGYPSLTSGAAGRPWRLSVDGGNPVPGLDLTGVDLYVPTEAGDDGSRATITIVTRGARGCVAHAGGETLTVDGFPVDVVSTLGAGDVFHGALLAALARGCRLREALVRANAAAALSCRALDGRTAIPTWDELGKALG